MPRNIGTLKGLGGIWDNMYEQSGRVYDVNDISPTVHTCSDGGQDIKIAVINPTSEGNARTIKAQYSNTSIANFEATGSWGGTGVMINNKRIRKLTPKECWRLMGFTDKDFEKARMALNETYYKGKDKSSSQLYKQAGNSIVTNCLIAIFYCMFFENSTNYERYLIKYDE